MSFEKFPAIKGHENCSCCGNQNEQLPLDKLLAVGFGYVSVTKNGKEIYNEMNIKANGWDDFWTVQDAENEALKAPNNDWRIHFVAPLYERHYRRQGNGLWVLYTKRNGFA